ncbi:hypothetical protein LTS18_013762, partial [Coniosporium uncinatum]
ISPAPPKVELNDPPLKDCLQDLIIAISKQQQRQQQQQQQQLHREQTPTISHFKQYSGNKEEKLRPSKFYALSRRD